jgi:hypothetical protein
MHDLINSVRSMIAEATALDYNHDYAQNHAHDATNIANSHSQHALRREHHKLASKMHQQAHDAHEKLAEPYSMSMPGSGKKYHNLLMQHHKNMIAYHNSEAE